MRILLDTHILLWFISGDHRLAVETRDRIRDPSEEVYLSVASIWEAIIKHQLGKLSLDEPPEVILPRERERHRIESLALDEPTVRRLAGLPPIHRDPFDRILVCQAQHHGLTIATADALIRAYPVPVLWAGR